MKLSTKALMILLALLALSLTNQRTSKTDKTKTLNKDNNEDEDDSDVTSNSNIASNNQSASTLSQSQLQTQSSNVQSSNVVSESTTSTIVSAPVITTNVVTTGNVATTTPAVVEQKTEPVSCQPHLDKFKEVQKNPLITEIKETQQLTLSIHAVKYIGCLIKVTSLDCISDLKLNELYSILDVIVAVVNSKTQLTKDEISNIVSKIPDNANNCDFKKFFADGLNNQNIYNDVLAFGRTITDDKGLALSGKPNANQPELIAPSNAVVGNVNQVGGLQPQANTNGTQPQANTNNGTQQQANTNNGTQQDVQPVAGVANGLAQNQQPTVTKFRTASVEVKASKNFLQ